MTDLYIAALTEALARACERLAAAAPEKCDVGSECQRVTEALEARVLGPSKSP